MTPEQVNDMWETVLSTGDPTAGNAHIRFARAIETATREECARVCRNLIANEGTSASIKVAKEVSNLCTEAIEGMK